MRGAHGFGNTYQRGSDGKKVVSTRYNSFGYLDRIERGSLVLWQAAARDASDRPTGIRFGNGLTQSKVFNHHSDRLESAAVVTATGVGRLQEGYTFDVLGNALNRTQYWDAGGFWEDFTYDALNRLSTSQVQGQALQNYGHNLAGNLVSKTGLGAYTYSAQGVGAIRPHATQSVASIGMTRGGSAAAPLTIHRYRTASTARPTIAALQDTRCWINSISCT